MENRRGEEEQGKAGMGGEGGGEETMNRGKRKVGRRGQKEKIEIREKGNR